MLYAVLFIAVLIRLSVLIQTIPRWPREWVLRKRVSNSIVQLVGALVLAVVPCHWLFHIELRNAFATAFLAEAVVQLRELLDVVLDMCIGSVSRNNRRR